MEDMLSVSVYRQSSIGSAACASGWKWSFRGMVLGLLVVGDVGGGGEGVKE